MYNSDWIDMEQLMDYTSIVNSEIYVLDQYNCLHNDLFNQIINKMINGFETILKTNGYCLFCADVDKIDNLWQKSRQYIPKDFNQNKNQLSQIKYLKSRNDLFNLKVDSPPILIIDNDIDLLNGKYHFANLRDLGIKCLPVISYMDCAKYFNKIIYNSKYKD